MSFLIHDERLYSNCPVVKNKSMQIGFWKTKWIEEHEKDLLRSLTKKEMQIFNSYRFFKNQIQFLGGRLLLKNLICSLQPYRLTMQSAYPFRMIPLNQIEILPDLANKNRPFVQIQNKKIDSFYFSISHKNNSVFVALDTRYPVSVDVEKIDERFLNVEKRFLSKPEVSLISKKEKTQHPFYYTSLWSVKECLIKLFNQPMYQILNAACVVNIAQSHRYSLVSVYASFHGFTSLLFCHQWRLNSYLFSVISMRDSSPFA